MLNVDNICKCKLRRKLSKWNLRTNTSYIYIVWVLGPIKKNGPKSTLHLIFLYFMLKLKRPKLWNPIIILFF